MDKGMASTRRSFLKAGALATAPLAAATSAAAGSSVELAARARRLEDEAVIRGLHESWLRRFNTGGSEAEASLVAGPGGAAFDSRVSRVAADHTGEADAITLAPDGQRATGRFHCLVQIEAEIPRTCTLGQMAHAQGEGILRRTELRVLTATYRKLDGRWTMETVRLD